MDNSKPFYTSVSFWGLIASIAAPFLAKHGILIDAETFAAYAVQAVAAGVGLWGVFRRPDITIK